MKRENNPITHVATEIIQPALEALGRLPGVALDTVDLDPASAGYSGDAVVWGQVQGQPVRFMIECGSNGTPGAVQRAIADLETRRATWPPSSVPLIAAARFSERSRDLLRAHHVAYWDRGGSLYVELPNALYWIDRPPPPALVRPRRNLYTGSGAQVLHALLTEPSRTWHLSELANRAEVSVSTAHQICTFLEEQLWMERAGKGPRTTRMLREPGALLDTWAAAHSLATYAALQFHRWTRRETQRQEAVTGALDEAGIEYALTLGAGADLVAPHGTASDHLWLLVPVTQSLHLEAAAAAAGLRRVEEGENVTVLRSHQHAPLMFRRKVGDAWVASDVQLYLDLSAWPRRGKELAQQLRRERLGF